MRRIVLVAPELLTEPGQDSVLRQRLPALERLAELGVLRRLSEAPKIETLEALYLGMHPSEAQMAQGPLTVSAFGADPPERSTHFHLSLMSLEDGVVHMPKVIPGEEEYKAIAALLPKLNTKLLTVVEGELLDHALVWESRGDLGITSAVEADGKSLRSVLPEGDAEPLLRRVIDDSVNLLFELEINQQRREEGLPPFNLLWPWGPGERTSVPNLALRRGEPVRVESDSLRLAGLARLAGYRHGDRRALGSGLNFRFSKLAGEAAKSNALIGFVGGAETLRSQGLLEELEWFVNKMDRELLQPLLDLALREPMRLVLISPRAAGRGLCLTMEHGKVGTNVLPFDERALEERRMETVDLWKAVEEGLDEHS